MAEKTPTKNQRPTKARNGSTAGIQERIALMTTLREHVQQLHGTQAEKAKILGITQPRLNDLLKNRTDKFSLDALVSLATKAGLRVNVNVQPVQIGLGSINQNLGPIHSVFAPAPSELGKLDSKLGTSMFLCLLRCEAIANGLSPKDVVLSLNINKNDGGIDAKVDKSPTPNSLLAKGSTHYQLKTGSSFIPWQPSALKKELFGKTNSKPSKKLLGNETKNCLDKDGTYTLVTLGHDLLPNEHTLVITHLTDLFQACGYVNPKVNVYGQSQIVGVLDKYPSICLDLIGLDDGGFLPISGWKNNAQMQLTLQLGSEQEKFIKEIRAALRENAVQHIRIIGEPGIGKTRLALESVSYEAIAPSVIYVRTGEEFQKSKLFNELLKPDRSYCVTLVIDDCDDNDRASIWSALKMHNGIKLITIDHGPDETHDSAMQTYHCPQLDEEQIKNILFSYIQKNTDLNKWAYQCSGSPRVAHVVGENLKNNPDDLLKEPADVPVWERFIIGHKKMDSTDARQHRIVLRYIALFQKFGFESPVSNEGQFICSLANKTDPAITWGRFQTIVQFYRNKRILQGHHTLFIVPKAFHIYLWIDFWVNHGREFPFQNFMEKLPSSMKDWFLQLFIYAGKAKPAQDVVKDILSPTGPFSDHSFLISGTGMRFLQYLSEADPQATLALLERTINTWSHEELHAWDTGRQDIVWALENIVVLKKLFVRAVNVLIPMALAENEDISSYSNNSKGLLLSLFKIGMGWAPTQAPPSMRYPILHDMVMSNDASRRTLGLEMCTRWLKTYGGTLGEKHQGLGPPIKFWRPETYSEIYEPCRQVLQILRTEMKGFNATDRNRVAEVLIGSANGLVQIEAMSNEILDILFELAQDKEINRRSLTRFVIWQLHHNNEALGKGILDRIKKLDHALTGTSLWERTNRYVLHTNWDDDYTFRGEEYKELDQPSKHVQHLAKEYLDDINVFLEHMPKLVRESGHRLPEFGAAFGKLAEPELDEKLLTYIESYSTDINGIFLGGYLGGLRTQDSERWGTLLHYLLSNQVTRNIAIDCIWRSGFTESLLREMLTLLKEGELDSTAFSRFAFRQEKDNVTNNLFQEVIYTLLEYSDNTCASICTQLVQDFYFGKDSSESFPEELIFKVLTTITTEDKSDTMYGYYWHNVAEGFLKRYPNRSIDLLDVILRNMGNIHHYHCSSYIENIAGKIVLEHPLEAWRISSELLISETKNRYEIIHWLSDTGFENSPKKGAINYMAMEEVISWIKEDIEQRRHLIQQTLPKTLEQEKGGRLTKLFIEEFGDDDRVTNGLFVHFHMGGWSGNESDYLSRKRDAARKWLSEVPSTKIQLWLGKYIDYLSDRIETTKIYEEREF